MRFHGGGTTDDRQTENAKSEASLNLRFAESGTKNKEKSMELTLVPIIPSDFRFCH